MKRSWLFLSAAVFAGAAAYFFYPVDTKQKHSVHDEETYLHFCSEIVATPSVYSSFRSHPLYGVFLEDLNEESAKKCLGYLETHYPQLLSEKALIASLDSIGRPLTIPNGDQEVISFPTLRDLKIGGDIEKYFGTLTGKTVVQIGAGDGSLTKILMTRHQPSRYCIVDIAPALALAQKTLGEWGVRNVEFYTPEEFTPSESIDLVISQFVFSESRRNIQEQYLKQIIRYARQGYLDCRFPMRHFGLKVWSQEQILSHLKSIGKHPQLVKEEPLTDIDSCLILFAL